MLRGDAVMRQKNRRMIPEKRVQDVRETRIEWDTLKLGSSKKYFKISSPTSRGVGAENIAFLICSSAPCNCSRVIGVLCLISSYRKVNWEIILTSRGTFENNFFVSSKDCIIGPASSSGNA